ncbi:MAG: anthranilate synthase component I [Chromatiales bacterium]|jgi:anthranilate synthase component 1|nr:anthranilate synthase component I [Chromatiales bacterium]MDP6149759.1 anthranilate synthase component I family protein [Gammaproteobacteria bacterium]MDP7092807.1 anthranilate synthase component I family protein [Gammaproteobacteria bacterium]MDP7270126.1 anthranilate synthase component I family protein [Gammaproteobacteria bacterium]HJP04139.1 anthranilate synthase component I family protein [Gammaproteobacteria bacterium]
MQPPFDIAADLDTPVSTYMKLGPLQPRFLLESVEKGAHLARYSFLGFGDALELRLDESGMRYGDIRVPRPASQAELLEALRDALARTPKLLPEVEGLPFSGGLVGAAGYDTVRYFERLENPPRDHSGPKPPEAAYLGTESMLVFDHLTRRIALLHAGSEAERQSLRTKVRDLLAGPLPAVDRGRYEQAEPSLSREEFMQRVDEAKEYITKGDIYQIVLSVRFAGKHSLHPFECYRALRLLNPSPYMFYCDLGDLQVVGSSPEALVRLHGSTAALRPIAGTRPRGADDAEDRANEESLLADEKENAEHVMLVDLARNDLGRVASGGTVHVEPYRSIERYSHVMHIVSGVQGELRSDCDAFDLFAAAFPAGTLVGAPKVRAMQLIDDLEPERRGIYAGTVGYFGNNGDMDQAIAIRSLIFQGDHYSYQAGAGIVADSQPEYEHDEVLAKSEILRRALAMAEDDL